jgi:hypothetical protein
VRTARGSTTVAHLVKAAEVLLEEGQHDEAAALLRSAAGLDPFRADVRDLLKRSRDAQLAGLSTVLPPDAVPRTIRAPAQAEEALGRRERKLLTQINGRWDVSALMLTSGLGDLETLRTLRSLVHAGFVVLDKRR